MERVTKTGVYRNKDGHATFLTEGSMAPKELLANYSLDSEASTNYGNEAERPYFGGVQDAPQNAEQRAQPAAPENRMEPAPAENRTDADLAASATKTVKKP